MHHPVSLPFGGADIDSCGYRMKKTIAANRSHYPITIKTARVQVSDARRTGFTFIAESGHTGDEDRPMVIRTFPVVSLSANRPDQPSPV
jgi:hypothetical protein